MNAHGGKTIMSGIQPSGDLHIGNYLGAMKQWVKQQDEMSAHDTFVFMLADMHAITVSFDPAELKEQIVDLTAWFLAAGLDPERAILFQQSENYDHAQLTWIFSCITPMGWLERMIQYKEKSTKEGERASTGLFLYPVLMATDILLYDAHEVPVGEDQTQHVELSRDIAKRFNSMFGEVFVEPHGVIRKEVGRVMSLQDPLKKMSKSDENQLGVIRLTDDPDTVVKKVKRAVTDSGDRIAVDEDKPALTNLLSMYAEFTGESVSVIEKKYDGSGYGVFKEDLADVIVSSLKPIQDRHNELMQNPTHIHNILDEGLQRAKAISSPKLARVRELTGLARR